MPVGSVRLQPKGQSRNDNAAAAHGSSVFSAASTLAISPKCENRQFLEDSSSYDEMF